MSPQKIQIPLWIAILININIVIGAAFFIGAGKIASLGGIFAPFAWLLYGLMLLPLIIAFARLATQFPAAGGLYVYSKELLGSLWGFVSGWGYFIGTAAANAAVLHAFSVELQKIEPTQRFLQSIYLDGMRFDFALVTLFTFFNLLNITFLERLQVLFTALKAIPLLLVLIAVPMLFKFENLSTAHVDIGGLFQTLPLIFFAYIGVEACCAIGDKIGSDKKSASRAIFISFALIVSIYAVLQFALICIHGTKDINPFTSILSLLTTNQSVIGWGNFVIHSAILSSFLSGFYGMFYYNNWNLYAIGSERSIVFWKYLTKARDNGAPWVCVLAQALLVLGFLVVTGGDMSPLYDMADISTTIAFLLSAISFLLLTRSLAGVLAIGSSTAFLLFIAHRFWVDGTGYQVLYFVLLLGVGLIAHKINELRA